MPLTTEEMQRIMVEVLTGAKRRVYGPEADEFRAGVEKDAEEAAAAGYVLEIPPEWPEVDV